MLFIILLYAYVASTDPAKLYYLINGHALYYIDHDVQLELRLYNCELYVCRNILSCRYLSTEVLVLSLRLHSILCLLLWWLSLIFIMVCPMRLYIASPKYVATVCSFTKVVTPTFTYTWDHIIKYADVRICTYIRMSTNANYALPVEHHTICSVLHA